MEHGLHVWFGCYENAFELVRAAYGEWISDEKQAITRSMGAGVREAALHRDRLGRPCGLCRHLLAKSRRESRRRRRTAHFLALRHPASSRHPRAVRGEGADLRFSKFKIPIGIAVLLAEAGVKIDYEPDTRDPESLFGLLAPFDKSFKATRDWAASLTQTPDLRTEKQLRGFARFLRLVSAHVWDDKNFRTDKKTKAKFLCELIDVGTALVEGVIIDMEIEGASVAELDALISGLAVRRRSAPRSCLWIKYCPVALQHDVSISRRRQAATQPRSGQRGAGVAAAVWRLQGCFPF